MMPGIGFAEMMMLVLVAIVVIGPKDLPLMMRKFGRFTGKMRALAFEFKQGIDELGRQAELEELRKEVADLKRHTGLDEIARDLEQDRINLERDVSSAMAPASLAPAQPTAPVEDRPAAGDDNRIGGAAVEAPVPAKQESPA
jgi:sec-independent protein translocase protein TatB